MKRLTNGLFNKKKMVKKYPIHRLLHFALKFIFYDITCDFILDNSQEDTCEKVHKMIFFMPEGQKLNTNFNFRGNLSSFFRFENRHNIIYLVRVSKLNLYSENLDH